MFERHFIIREKYTAKKKPRISPEHALRKAAAAGNYDDVLVLIPHVSNINTQSPDSNRTALHWAGLNGHGLIYRLLEQNGAFSGLPDQAQKTPLDYLKESPDGLALEPTNYLYTSTGADHVILNEIILRFLNYKDILHVLAAGRYLYHHNFLIDINRALQIMPDSDSRSYLSKIPYHQLINPRNPLEMSLEDRKKWAKAKFNFRIHSKYLSNPHALIILHHYLLPERTAELFRHTELTNLVLSRSGCLLFQNHILNNEIISRIILEPDNKLFALLMRVGVDELIKKEVTLESIWDRRVDINTLIRNFGSCPSFVEAMAIVDAGNHLREASYDFSGDYKNSPYRHHQEYFSRSGNAY